MKQLLILVIFSVAMTGAKAQVRNSLSASDKVYGLSKFWQEVNYNFVYLDKLDRKGWDSAYRSLITEVQQTGDDYQYYRLLQKFCARLKDGHTNVFFPEGIQQMNTMFGSYRLFFKNIGGRQLL